MTKETSGSNLLLIFNDLFGTQEKIDAVKLKVNLQAKDIDLILHHLNNLIKANLQKEIC